VSARGALQLAPRLNVPHGELRKGGWEVTSSLSLSVPPFLSRLSQKLASSSAELDPATWRLQKISNAWVRVRARVSDSREQREANIGRIRHPLAWCLLVLLRVRQGSSQEPKQPHEHLESSATHTSWPRCTQRAPFSVGERRNPAWLLSPTAMGEKGGAGPP
jgi:hypothetical protein